MSLYIGQLSPEANADDIERVFGKFGKCTIKMKDRYGFVVYGNPSNAERALRTLRGTSICGHVITLSWSNQQPHGLKGVGRGGKLYDPPHRRYIVANERRVAPYHRQGYGRGFRKTDDEFRRQISSNFVRTPAGHDQDDSNAPRLRERNRSRGNEDSAVKIVGADKLEDGDRWEDKAEDDLSIENYLESGIEFDRYEPYSSDGKKDPNEQHPSGKRQERSDNTSRKRNRRRFKSPAANDVKAVKRRLSSSSFQSRFQDGRHERETVDARREDHSSGPDLSISDEAQISSDELYAVLRRNGLRCPDKNERKLPVELYFGSSRLWPWAIIYYRRSKKGLV